MRIGVVFPTLEVIYPGPVPDLAQAVEDLGFIHVSAWDHVVGVDGLLILPTRRGPVRRVVAAEIPVGGCPGPWFGTGRGVGSYRRGSPALTADTHAFRGVLCAKVLILKPSDPEAKGLLEHTHGYLETSFLPGRSFTARRTSTRS